jgi:hypothetical protein
MRGVFMGDVVFETDATFTFTIAGPVTYDVNILAGSWFASALHLWLYVLSQANAGLSTSYTVALDPETRILTFTGNPSCDVPTVDGIGFASGSQTLTTSAALDGVFSPVWPIVSLSFAVDNLNGGACAAADGTMYTYHGAAQEKCSVSLFVDRTSGAWSEWQAWLYMWHTYWLQGRFVVLYIDEADVAALTATGRLGTGIALQFSAGQTGDDAVHRFSRLVENANRRDLTDRLTFYVRRGIPEENADQAWYLRT